MRKPNVFTTVFLSIMLLFSILNSACTPTPSPAQTTAEETAPKDLHAWPETMQDEIDQKDMDGKLLCGNIDGFGSQMFQIDEDHYKIKFATNDQTVTQVNLWIGDLGYNKLTTAQAGDFPGEVFWDPYSDHKLMLESHRNWGNIWIGTHYKDGGFEPRCGGFGSDQKIGPETFDALFKMADTKGEEWTIDVFMEKDFCKKNEISMQGVLPAGALIRYKDQTIAVIYRVGTHYIGTLKAASKPVIHEASFDELSLINNFVQIANQDDDTYKPNTLVGYALNCGSD